MTPDGAAARLFSIARALPTRDKDAFFYALSSMPSRVLCVLARARAPAVMARLDRQPLDCIQWRGAFTMLRASIVPSEELVSVFACDLFVLPAWLFTNSTKSSFYARLELDDYRPYAQRPRFVRQRRPLVPLSNPWRSTQ